MFLRWLGRIGKAHVVLAVLVFAVLNGPGNPRQIGDRLQIALPSIAFACSVLNGSGGEYALRFATMMIVAHGSKHALGQAPINIRPDGGDLGFPSAHTSAAVIGASSIVYECFTANPVAKALIVISAGFVGGSRIDSDRHDIWQVLAGALLGWGCDRALRRDSHARRKLAGWLAPLGRPLTTLRQIALRVMAKAKPGS
ncbi:MAG: phosphoesterase [Rhodobacteraceae bacterium PARR1]|nr:MAG: phosphoesterase [Rhodobacteraceae bacterium PARR1]